MTPNTPSSQVEMFEQALAANPNDISSRCAYADYLAERGDPRGEFMLVQIALEDESRSKAERNTLREQERALLEKHERDWLGILAPHLLDRVPDDETRPATEHCWRRGFLAELKVGCLTVALAQSLADAPAARLLEKLHVVSSYTLNEMNENQPPRRVPIPPGCHHEEEWFELLGAPLLKSVRVFQMGDEGGEPPEDGWCDNHTQAFHIERLIAEMSRIEELHLLCKHYDSAVLFGLPNLTNLRVLRMYALGDPGWEGEEIQLDILANNSALGNLTHLMIHPHLADQSVIPIGQAAPVFRSPHLQNLTHLQLRLSNMGDEGVREIIDSGILKRLKWLDLRHGCITDQGARLFADCSYTRNLERLDLSRNAVSAAGLKVLLAAGVKAVANNSLTAEELANQEYLHEGDFE